MLFVLAGGLVGLLRHPSIAFFWPFLLLLYIPFNLFLSLAIRDLILHSFERNRFRELFAILVVTISILPQLLLRTGLGVRSAPFFLRLANATAAPWHEVARLSTGQFSLSDLALLAFWIGVAYWAAKRQFERSLTAEDSFRPAAAVSSASPEAKPASLARTLLDIPNRLFADPTAALVQKEFQTLLRMPRFRVLFGMACVFSVVIFVPMALNSSAPGNSFMKNNFLPVVTLYGLLLLSDALLLNVFGFDRRAAQIYFLTPVPFATVLKAKNLTAIAIIATQALTVLCVAALFRASLTASNIANALLSAAVVATFFLGIGNLISIVMARPIDPKQTFKKQAGGKMQLWFFLCSLGMFILVGFAFLARWALQSEWALAGVLSAEWVIGLIVYRVATQSAIERGLRDREQLIDALSKGGAPVSVGM